MLYFELRRREWSTNTFGSLEHRGPMGCLKHLLKEIDETAQTVVAGKPDIVEFADLLFLALDAAWRSKVSTYDMMLYSHFSKLSTDLSGCLHDLRIMRTNVEAMIESQCVNQGRCAYLFIGIFSAANNVEFSSMQLVDACWHKLLINERRVWPDWRNADANTPIEHDRSHDSAAESVTPATLRQTEDL